MARSLQYGVLRPGFFQDGDVGVGILPEGEKILVGGERADAGGVGICSLRSSRLQGVGTGYAQMRQRSRPAVLDDAAVVDDFLKLGGRSGALSGCQVCLAAYIQMIEAGTGAGKLDRGGSLQCCQGSSGVLLVQRQLRLNRWQATPLHPCVQRGAFPQASRQGLGSALVPPHRKRKRGFSSGPSTGRSKF